MDPLVIGLVAASAVLHVSWNVRLKTAGDPLHAATIGQLTAAAAIVPLGAIVWLVGGGSGHGFKNGPAVGKRVAAHILDKDLAVEPRFAFATKGTVAARTVF